jgi:hypothetical protein
MNVLCTLWVIASGAMIVIYIRYALANYPRSWRWELLLIGSSFIWGVVMGSIVFPEIFSGGQLVLYLVLTGAVSVFLNRYLGVPRMMFALPKKPTRNNSK